jgi:hypothetical protein
LADWGSDTVEADAARFRIAEAVNLVVAYLTRRE